MTSTSSQYYCLLTLKQEEVKTIRVEFADSLPALRVLVQLRCERTVNGVKMAGIDFEYIGDWREAIIKIKELKALAKSDEDTAIVKELCREFGRQAARVLGSTKYVRYLDYIKLELDV